MLKVEEVYLNFIGNVLHIVSQGSKIMANVFETKKLL